MQLLDRGHPLLDVAEDEAVALALHEQVRAEAADAGDDERDVLLHQHLEGGDLLRREDGGQERVAVLGGEPLVGEEPDLALDPDGGPLALAEDQVRGPLLDHDLEVEEGVGHVASFPVDVSPFDQAPPGLAGCLAPGAVPAGSFRRRAAPPSGGARPPPAPLPPGPLQSLPDGAKERL